MLFLMGSDRTGLARILSMDNAPTTPPDTISADACIYANVNLNVAWLLDEIERMVRRSDPAAADQMRATLEGWPSPSDGQPINVRRDFLDHLRGPLTFTMGFTKPLGAGSLRMLIGMGHRDQAAVARFLGNLVGMLMPRDLRGTQVFDVPFPPGLTVAPTADRLVIGNTAAVEGALEPAAAQPLAETAAWRRAARFVPDESWLTFYMDKRRLMAATLELAEKQDELMLGGMTFDGMVLEGMLEGFQAEMGDGAGGARHKQKLLDYTAPAILTISSTEEGVRITHVQLKPER